MKKPNKYKKFIISYYLILIVLISFCSFYVYRVLINYEKHQPENFVWEVIKDIKTDPVKYGNVKKEHSSGYKDLLKNSEIKVIEEEGNFSVLTDEKPVFTITLKDGKAISKLGLLHYNEQILKNVKPLSDKGAYYYTVRIPSNFTLKIAGKNQKKIKEVVNEEFEEINHELLPKDYIYEINKPSKSTKIEIYNNFNELVEPIYKDNSIYSYDFYKTDNYNEKIIKKFDVLNFAKNWSLLLTNDLPGKVSSLKPYLIDGLKITHFANKWSSGEDIGMISNHVLLTPPFTNESVTDCYIYNEKAFSCLVKFEKNMRLTRTGEKKIESLNDRLYFVYDEGWKFVDISYVGD